MTGSEVSTSVVKWSRG